jgi:hypothetical protein
MNRIKALKGYFWKFKYSLLKQYIYEYGLSYNAFKWFLSNMKINYNRELYQIKKVKELNNFRKRIIKY